MIGTFFIHLFSNLCISKVVSSAQVWFTSCLKTWWFLSFQAAETQVLLESLENQLQDEKQRNWDLQEEVGEA